MGGAITLCAQCILRRWRQMVALGELLGPVALNTLSVISP